MLVFREIWLFLYHLVIWILCLVSYVFFLTLSCVSFVIYRLWRVIKGLWKVKMPYSSSVVISGAGSGMGQMIAVDYAKKVFYNKKE